MTDQTVNTIGLIFNMIGILIIFYFGPPQPSFEEGVSLDLEDANLLSDGTTVAEHDRKIKKLKAVYSRMSKIGLGFIFFGFAFQLWGVLR